jgi:F420-non-reducing hydrogenase large subunit
LTKGITKEQQKEILELGNWAVEFAQFSLQLFGDIVLGNKEYLDLIVGDIYTHQTYYMGMVDENNHVNFYDGKVRVVGPDGEDLVKYAPEDYTKHIAEHVEPWTYVKFPFLKRFGWKGFVDGPESGLYAVAPLARLNASTGMATPVAQEAHDEMYATLGGKPVHHTLANHWARVIELIYAAERLQELAADPVLVEPEVRTLPTEVPTEGMGVVEAPRGTLFHHYATDERGIIESANLIVATQNNAARIAMSVDKAAKGLISKGKVSDGILNKIEMAFRAYDPCHACATHSLPGSMPLLLTIRDAQGEVVTTLRRDGDGAVIGG